MRDKLFEKESRIGMFKAKRLLARSIALLVIAALSISVMPVFSLSYNETGDISDEKPVQNEYCEDPDLSGDVDGLRYIDSAEIERQGFIRRLKEKESLNSYAFLNRDGTESVVLFADNIKYVDESGEIVEKDTAIVRNPSGGFTVKANDYGVLFPENIKDGLQFEYLEGCISMIPDGAGGEYIIEDNSISYLNVFGENTILRYTPLLNGIKEDIVISGYSGINSFGFEIRSGNLRFSDKGTGRVLVNENGEPVIEFGDVIACDSKGKLSAGTLLIEENGENSYHLTVSIPEEFLTDPKTVYPVTIDPTVFESSDGSAIQDATVFSMFPNLNYGSYAYNSIGFTALGPSRTVLWLYCLETDPIYRTLDAEEIVSVKLSLLETTGNDSKYVNLYRISEDVSWTENNVTYNNVGTFDTGVNKGDYLNNGERTEFDITSFAKGWKNLSYANTSRVIFTMSGGEMSSGKQVGASSCEIAGKRPYIVYTYQLKNLMEEGTYYIRNRHIDRFLQPTNGSSSVNTGLELNAFSGSDSQKWEVIYRGNGYYTIKNVNSEYALSVPSGSYSTYDVQLIQASDTQADGQLWRIYMTSYCGFAIKPKSACGPNDGTGWSDRTMSVADGNDGNGALVTQRPYVYNNSFKDEWYLMPIDISETVNYEIENSQLGSYLRPEDGYVYGNNGLELWEHSNNNNLKWKFTAVGNGYYKISPYSSSLIAITIATGNETTENGGVIQNLYTADNPRQQWFIYKVPHGYALKARSAGINNLVLSVSEGNLGNGAVVSQRAYVNNLSYKEEWILHNPDLIENGVYYISMGTYCCGIPTGAISEHISASISSYSSNSVWLYLKASKMWKIKKLENGRYSVRPLHKLDMGLNECNGDVDIISIGTNDILSAVDDSAEWTIEKKGEQFIFKSQGDSNKTLTATGTSVYSNINVAPYSSGNTSQLWTLTRIAEENIPTGIIFYHYSTGHFNDGGDIYIAPKQQLSLVNDIDIVVSVVDSSNINNCPTWSIQTTDNPYLSIDFTSGDIEGVCHKGTGITVSCKVVINSSPQIETYSAFVTPLSNGTFYIKNSQNKTFAKVENDILMDNQNAVQYELNGCESEKWIFDLNCHTGYYTIKSGASGNTPFYLSVYNDSSSSGSNIVVKSKSGLYFPYGMQWKVKMAYEGIADFRVKIIPRTGESPDGIRPDYVLSTENTNTSNGIHLVQKENTDNLIHIDEWLVDNIMITLCAIPASGLHQHEIAFDDTPSKFHLKKHWNVLTTISDQTVDKTVELIRVSEIFIIRTHGDSVTNLQGQILGTYMVLNDSTSSPLKLYSNSITGVTGNDVLPGNSTFDYFAKARIVLIVGCKTGAGVENGNQNNLLGKLIEQGAGVAVGFGNDIVCQEGTVWMNRFVECFLNSESVETCISEVAESFSELHPDANGQTKYHYYGLDSVCLCGDTSITIDDIVG
jgi:hypothetical protein